MTPKHDDSEKELVEACKTAVRDLLGPVVGTPEWLAKHGKKIEARHDRHAEAITSAVLTAARPIIEMEVKRKEKDQTLRDRRAGAEAQMKHFVQWCLMTGVWHPAATKEDHICAQRARDYMTKHMGIDLTDPKDGDHNLTEEKEC